MENQILKHLLYTQALCEITLEKVAIILANQQGTSPNTVQRELIAEVKARAAELRSMI